MNHTGVLISVHNHYVEEYTHTFFFHTTWLNSPTRLCKWIHTPTFTIKSNSNSPSPYQMKKSFLPLLCPGSLIGRTLMKNMRVSTFQSATIAGKKCAKIGRYAWLWSRFWPLQCNVCFSVHMCQCKYDICSDKLIIDIFCSWTSRLGNGSSRKMKRSRSWVTCGSCKLCLFPPRLTTHINLVWLCSFRYRSQESELNDMRVKLSRFMTKGAPILMPVSSSAAAAAYQQTKARESKQRLYKGRPPQQPKRPVTARKKEASLSSASVGSSAGGGGKQGSFASDFALPHQPISPSPRQPVGQAAAAAKRAEAADAGGQLPPPPQPTSSSVVFIDSHKSGATAVSIESQSSAGGGGGGGSRRRDKKTSAISVVTNEESQE